MSADPINRLPVAFGTLLKRLRVELNLSQEALAVASGFANANAVVDMERGGREPTLTELFRIANTLRMPETILFVDVVAEWRADPTDYGHYKSRASDFARLHRLGYYHGHGDFRELPRVYSDMDEATAAARTLNTARQSKGLPPLNTVLIYVRLGSAAFRPDAEEQP